MEKVSDDTKDFFFKKHLDFSEAEISKFCADMNTRGVAEIHNVIRPWVIEEARDYLLSEGKRMNLTSFSLRWNSMQSCVLTDLQKNRSLKKFLSSILNAAGVDAKDDEYIHHVVRCTNGLTNKADAHAYHFDQYNLTALMPIETPSDPCANCGDLVVYPNLRGFSTNVVANLIYKAFFQNGILSRLMRTRLAKYLFKAEVIKVKPGNLYLFYGYRTFHGNLPIDEKFRRMTALFHYNDPFSDNEIFKGLEAYRPPPQQKKNAVSRIRIKLGYFGVLVKGVIAEAKK